MFDGQSLNNIPSGPGYVPYPAQMMAGTRTPWVNAAISGTSITNLAPSAARRVDALQRPYESSVFVFTGANYDLTENDTAAFLMGELAAYCQARRDAGFDKIIVNTIPPATLYTAPQEAVRQEVNALIKASPLFDAVGDIGAAPELQVPSAPFWYFDGVHWTNAGATIAANVVRPVLASVLKV